MTETEREKEKVCVSLMWLTRGRRLPEYKEVQPVLCLSAHRVLPVKTKKLNCTKGIKVKPFFGACFREISLSATVLVQINCFLIDLGVSLFDPHL